MACIREVCAATKPKYWRSLICLQLLQTFNKEKTDASPLCPQWSTNGTYTTRTSLSRLDSLSRQLIQRAKCYYTLGRLGTYTVVPIYNSLKACKGTMFILPLPLNKTLETLDQVKQSGDTALPEPELYIIVNGRPTKSKVV